MVVANDIKVEAQQELRALRRQLQEEQERNATLSADLEALQGVRYHFQHVSFSPVLPTLGPLCGYILSSHQRKMYSSKRLQNKLSEQEEMYFEWRLFSSEHMSSWDLATFLVNYLSYPWKLLPSLSCSPTLTIALLNNLEYYWLNMIRLSESRRGPRAVLNRDAFLCVL